MEIKHLIIIRAGCNALVGIPEIFTTAMTAYIVGSHAAPTELKLIVGVVGTATVVVSEKLRRNTDDGFTRMIEKEEEIRRK